MSAADDGSAPIDAMIGEASEAPDGSTATDGGHDGSWAAARVFVVGDYRETCEHLADMGIVGWDVVDIGTSKSPEFRVLLPQIVPTSEAHVRVAADRLIVALGGYYSLPAASWPGDASSPFPGEIEWGVANVGGGGFRYEAAVDWLMTLKNFQIFANGAAIDGMSKPFVWKMNAGFIDAARSGDDHLFVATASGVQYIEGIGKQSGLLGPLTSLTLPVPFTNVGGVAADSGRLYASVSGAAGAALAVWELPHVWPNALPDLVIPLAGAQWAGQVELRNDVLAVQAAYTAIFASAKAIKAQSAYGMIGEAGPMRLSRNANALYVLTDHEGYVHIWTDITTAPVLRATLFNVGFHPCGSAGELDVYEPQ